MALYEKVDAKFVEDHLCVLPIVDVRPKLMYLEEGHIPGSINIEWIPVRDAGGRVADNYASLAEFHGLDKEWPIIVHCEGGEIAEAASQALAEGGFQKIHCYVPSFKDWIKDPGHPVIKTDETETKA